MENFNFASENSSFKCDFIKASTSVSQNQSITTFRQNGPVEILSWHENDEEATRIKFQGQSKPTLTSPNYVQCSMFRLTPGPGLVISMKAWNKLMKCYNGNKKRLNKPNLVVNAPSFNIIHQNIPGGKFQTPANVGTYIELLIKRFHPALLFLTEVDPDMVEPNIPDGYKFHRGTLKDKDNIRISLLIKVTQKYEIEELNLEVPTISVKMGTWRFVGIYREWTYRGDPLTKDRRDLEFLRLKTLVKWIKRISRGRALLIGDMNFDPNDPVTPHQHTLNEIRDYMASEVTDRGWLQLVQEITRSRKGEEPAILDHLYTNQEDFVECVFRENVTGSDHYAVGAKVRLNQPVFMATTFFARSIKNIPQGEFERVFTSSRIYEVYQAPNVNAAVDTLEFKVVRTLNIVAPMKRITTRPHYAKWLTEELKIKIKRRNAMRLRAERSKKMEDWTVFKNFQKVLSKQLREARQASFVADMDVKCAKQRWKAVRKHTGINEKKRDEGIELEIDGELVDEPNKVATTLNEYFRDKVVNLRKKLKCSVEESLDYTDEYLQDKTIKDFEFKQVSRTYVKGIIRNLANTGAKGRDQIGTDVLKRYRNVLTGPITHIVNMSIFHGEYPAQWKLGVITPLPKGGKKTDPKNWRPICINTAMSKILETVLNNQISYMMESRGIYSTTQHAYRKVRSVSTALLELDTMARTQLNKGKTVAILTTDISAGFNLVSRQILVPKMAKYGFGPNSCKLLDNYLTGRRTKVKINNIVSPEVELETGVGEGSVLGPNFFSCGLTDISVVAKRVERKLREEYRIDAFVSQIEYADDTTGILACENERELQIAVDELLAAFGNFYSANGLKLNEDKCHVLVVRPHLRYMTIKCAGKDEVSSLRLLGLFIDNKLQFDVHTKIVCGRLTAKINALEKLRSKASFKTRKEVTVSLIHSTIEFCGEIYLRPYRNQVKIQKRLNSAMRMLLDKDFDDSVTEMLLSLRWLNVSNMWRWCMIRTLKRIMGAPRQTPHLWEVVNLNTDPARNVRYNSLKLTWRKNTRWARDSYIYQAVDCYNSLGLHGRLFADYEDMRDQIQMSLISKWGNRNLK